MPKDLILCLELDLFHAECVGEDGGVFYLYLDPNIVFVELVEDPALRLRSQDPKVILRMVDFYQRLDKARERITKNITESLVCNALNAMPSQGTIGASAKDPVLWKAPLTT